MDLEITLRVNGATYQLSVDTRTTLLDALRERLGLTGPKKGCDHGQCGACTVLLDGRRVNSCLALAVAHQDAQIVTVDERLLERMLTTCILSSSRSSTMTLSSAATVPRGSSARRSACCARPKTAGPAP